MLLLDLEEQRSNRLYCPLIKDWCVGQACALFENIDAETYRCEFIDAVESIADMGKL